MWRDFGSIMIEQPDIFFGPCLLIGVAYVLAYWLAYRTMYFYLVRKYPEVEQRKTRYTYLVIYVLVIYLIIKLILKFVLPHDNMHQFITSEFGHNLTEVITSLLVTTAVLSIYEGSYAYKKIHDTKLKIQLLERNNIQSQLEGLKSQVNPHFLFNSLNTLCNIIPQSPDRAEEFVRKLSKVYRYILEIRDKELIRLEEELEYLNAYTHLCKERFGSNLNINIDIQDEHLNKQIVPLSLQILFENAIKHNIISKEKPLTISVKIDGNGRLVVSNNLQVKRQVPASTKFGLQSIKERYQFFTDKAVDVIQTTQNFIVVIPLISNLAR